MRFIAKQRPSSNRWCLYDEKTDTFVGFGYTNKKAAEYSAEQVNRRHNLALSKKLNPKEN